MSILSSNSRERSIVHVKFIFQKIVYTSFPSQLIVSLVFYALNVSLNQDFSKKLTTNSVTGKWHWGASKSSEKGFGFTISCALGQPLFAKLQILLALLHNIRVVLGMACEVFLPLMQLWNLMKKTLRVAWWISLFQTILLNEHRRYRLTSVFKEAWSTESWRWWIDLWLHTQKPWVLEFT
jgi:hypothetical protein